MLKQQQIGEVKITVEEARETKKVNYVIVSHDDREFQTAVVTGKDVTDQKWNETFTFPVYTLQSNIDVIVAHKRVIGKDKHLGHIKIPVLTLSENPDKHEWFPLTKTIPPKDIKKMITKAPEQIGQIRLHIVFKDLKPKAEKKTKGFAIEGEWTKETAGGFIMNSGHWMLNPQYLLNVKEDSKISIRIFQPEGVEERVSFYILKYDEEYYKGRPKTLCTQDDIVKIESFWAAIPAPETEATLFLEESKYVIVPCCDNVEYNGKFTMDIFASEDFKTEKFKDKDYESNRISVKMLPKKGTQWISKELKGEWTKETAGGGNIVGTRWRKNPQFLVHSEEDMNCTIVISQEGKDAGIGFYVSEYIGYGKKTIDYSKEVTKTSSFKFLPSSGVNNINLKATTKYVIIPCTSEPTVGKFTLRVFSNKSFEFSEIKSTWPCVTRKRNEWKEETAGGSPNSDTFLDNPQYLLSFSELRHTEFVVDLRVTNEADSVGYLIVKWPKGKEKRIESGKLSNDDIWLKPEGWVNRISVSLFGTATEKAVTENNFIIIPSTFKSGVEKKFELAVYSDNPCELQLLGEDGIIDQPEVASDDEKVEQEKKEETKSDVSKVLLKSQTGTSSKDDEVKEPNKDSESESEDEE